jgi:hypothetical protein
LLIELLLHPIPSLPLAVETRTDSAQCVDLSVRQFHPLVCRQNARCYHAVVVMHAQRSKAWGNGHRGEWG